MAVQHGHTTWKSRGVLGATYFRRSRGRTIQCERPSASNGGAVTRSPGQASQRNKFGAAMRYATIHAASIKSSFDKTRYGSERNYFMKLNSYVLGLALQDLLSGVDNLDRITDEEIATAIETYAAANPTAIFRVKKRGYPVEYLTGVWDDGDTPDPVEPQFSSMTVNAAPVQNDDNVSVNTGDVVVIKGSGLAPSKLKMIVVNSSMAVSTVNIADFMEISTSTNTQVSGTVKAAYDSHQLSELLFNNETVLEFFVIDLG